MKDAIFLIIISVLLMIPLSGCAAKGAAEKIANPIMTVAAAQDLSVTGVVIDAPQGAQDVLYSTISDKVAQVTFSYDGKAFTYRAGNTDDDISGVYESFDDMALSRNVDGDGWSVSIDVKTVSGGDKGALASWKAGQTSYTLYTAQKIGAEAMADIAAGLAEAALTR